LFAGENENLRDYRYAFPCAIKLAIDNHKSNKTNFDKSLDDSYKSYIRMAYNPIHPIHTFHEMNLL